MFQQKTEQIKTFMRQWQLQSMVIPGIVWMFIFCYIPMFWLIIAFMDYNIAKPMLESPFVGMKHFQDFVMDDRFWRSIRNTLGMSSIRLVLGFPIPILFALLLNEIRSIRFKRTVQTISYLPHFIAWTIFGGIMLNWLGEGGVINQLMMALGIQQREILFNSDPKYFWWIAFFSDTLKETGWSAIIYIAAISGIDPGLYEAAELDGANRWQRMWYITIQCIRPTIAILFILAVSGLLGSNFEQIFMLKNNMNMKMAESIDLYIYNMGLVSGRYSFSTAVLFARSIVALGLLFLANFTSKKLNGEGIF
ncbi:ABC transporter permease subunit [Paenibacillus motobuensis]|uniref:ABC transporter permease n=1 Tax=Paenibacillus TaxID=44249 RepID=UPI002040CD25|nr:MULTISPECIES: ABC transporter permease subunit [Paenibacillus]MCM3042258.1 ABC transporter permease subunit [Paenibacillus lutimineralis]MCM3649362.1 ABC transporter permease subunit [Paenibacillus motobuensis]